MWQAGEESLQEEGDRREVKTPQLILMQHAAIAVSPTGIPYRFVCTLTANMNSKVAPVVSAEHWQAFSVLGGRRMDRDLLNLSPSGEAAVQ